MPVVICLAVWDSICRLMSVSRIVLTLRMRLRMEATRYVAEDELIIYKRTH